MSRSLFVGLWSAWVTGAVATLLLGLAAIWFDSGDAGDTAFLIGFPTLFSLIGLIPASVVDGVPPRGPSRKVRRQMRDEQDRIHLDAAIRRAEREAGIR